MLFLVGVEHGLRPLRYSTRASLKIRTGCLTDLPLSISAWRCYRRSRLTTPVRQGREPCSESRNGMALLGSNNYPASCPAMFGYRSLRRCPHSVASVGFPELLPRSSPLRARKASLVAAMAAGLAREFSI